MDDSFGMADSPLVRAHAFANLADACYRNRRYHDAAINHGRAAVLLEEAMQQFSDSAVIDCLRQQRIHHLDQERLFGLLILRMKHCILKARDEAVTKEEQGQKDHSEMASVPARKRTAEVAAAAPVGASVAASAVNAASESLDDPLQDYCVEFEGNQMKIPNCPAAMVKLYEFKCTKNDAMVNQLKALRSTIEDLALRLQMQEAGRLDAASEIS